MPLEIYFTHTWYAVLQNTIRPMGHQNFIVHLTMQNMPDAARKMPRYCTPLRDSSYMK